MNFHSGFGIVLRRLRHLEEDARITIFLRNLGKVTVVSKAGLRMSSRLKALQEPFSEADFQIYLPSQGTQGRLTGGKLIDSHSTIRLRINAFAVASRCCESVEKLLPFRASSPEVFDTLHDVLVGLETAENPETEWIGFGSALLKDLGHGDMSDKLSGLPLEGAVRLVNEELRSVLPGPLQSDIAFSSSASSV